MSEEIKFNPPLSVKAGQIQFVEACHPPLTAGEYKAGMSQVIKASKDSDVPWNSDPYLSSLVFSVDAPRFTLNPADIHSVYPPVNADGKFSNALPHVVFTRRTLPWERTLDGKAPEFGKAFPAWMGLILLTEAELKDSQTGRTRENLSMPVFSKETDSLLMPRDRTKVLVPNLGQYGDSGSSDADVIYRCQKWAREKWQYENDAGGDNRSDDDRKKASCLTIDLPAELFKAIAPRYDDLNYLAHVRQIDTGDKEVLGINDKGWFSLVIGNRMPQAGQRHHAFLVSLEGYQDRLKENWNPEPGQQVRLAVLGTWSFTCTAPTDFKTLMDCLNFDCKKTTDSKDRIQLPDSWLHLPYDPYKDGTKNPADIVNAAYSRGYTAFDHIMRQGEKTVSWYRGPLVPLNYDKPIQVQEPVSCADELLRYDPDIGLFDTTYAAAWQLGRLLALQNQSFALALNQARKVMRKRARWLLHRTALKKHYREIKIKDDNLIEDSLMDSIVEAGNKLKQAVPE